MIPLLSALAVLLLALLAEWLHVRRIRAVGRLAFGPMGRANRWTGVLPLLRPLCLAAFTWGLATLILLRLAAADGNADQTASNKAATRLVFVAELSPSMYLTDAGADGKLTRQARMREVVEGILQRVSGNLRFGVIGFYTESLPVVMEARDPELVRNVFNGLPLTLDTESIALSRPFIVPNNPKLDPPSMGRHGLPDELWGITLIGKALYGAADVLAQRPNGDRMVILITDGESSDIKSPKDLAIIAALRAQNIIVFGILMTEDQIEPALVGIARSTGGEVFNAATPAALQSVFKSIDAMKKVVVLEKKPRVADLYDPFIPPAIALLVLSVLALFGLRFTPW
ncbi:MAG: vWA domain-containing protein [Limisphaerales bacterium]